jgi:hypothetical protein
MKVEVLTNKLVKDILGEARARYGMGRLLNLCDSQPGHSPRGISTSWSMQNGAWIRSNAARDESEETKRTHLGGGANNSLIIIIIKIAPRIHV